MLVLSMNSKRQRRPNVRLGEIGDISAAFACGFSQRNKENLGHKRWKSDFVNPTQAELNPVSAISKQISSEFVVSEDPGVSPRNSADMQQNRENKNPNSSKSVLEFASSDEIDMTKSKLNFGTIRRKCRVMKRRGQSTRSNNYGFGSGWSSKLSPEFSSENGKEYEGKEFVQFSSEPCNDYYHFNGFKDVSDDEIPTTSKKVSEFDTDEPNNDVWQLGNFSDLWKEDPRYECNDSYAKVDGSCDEMRCGGTDVNTVRRWLEDLGFGKYAAVFEMHEVDEEALPLLTLEDLKEMGVFAVGPRRKLYTAIQQLRRGDVST